MDSEGMKFEGKNKERRRRLTKNPRKNGTVNDYGGG
jgi:hypothetical protein